MGLEVVVCDPLAYPLAEIESLTADYGRRVQAVLNDAGSASFSILWDDAQRALLGTYAWVKFVLDGDTVFAMRIEPLSQNTVASGEEADEDVTYTNAGAMATLADAVIAPHPGCALKHDTRYFNFASLDYYDWTASPWIPAEELFQQGDVVDSLYGIDVPEDWPDPSAWWIWGTPVDLLDDPLMAIGDCYFRTTVDLGASGKGDYALFIAADDGYELWVDGVLVAARTEAFMFRQTSRVDLHLEGGDHTIAIKGTNITRPVSSTNFAAVLFAMYSTFDGGELGLLEVHSDSTWQALAYPATPPGMTPGEILIVLFDEAWSRNVLWNWWGYVTMTEEVDENGDAWDHEVEIGFRLGSTMYDAVRQLAETHIDVGMDYDLIALRAVNKGGLDVGAAVTITTGVDLVSLSHRVEPRRASKLLVRQADGSLTTVDSGVVGDGDDPIVEAYIEAGSAPSSDAADGIAEGVFDQFQDPKAVATFAWDPTVAGQLPLVDVFPGKTITLPDTDRDPVSSLVRTATLADRSAGDDGVVDGSIDASGEAEQAVP